MFVSAIIAAGGHGTRVGGDIPKQLLEVGGVPILQRTIDLFVNTACVDEIIVSLPVDLVNDPPSYLLNRTKPVQIVPGGARRQDSVARAFERVSTGADVVVVHDAARPFATERLINDTVRAASESGAAVAAVAARDTVKQAALYQPGEPATVERTLPRDHIFLAQTPQAFRREVLAAAITLAHRDGIEATDEAGLVEHAGHAVRLVTGDAENIKITTVNDLLAGGAPNALTRQDRDLLRIGTGYDLHRLVAGRPLTLAGVTIPFDKGPIGHSDGDVLCHALIDAVLGAAAAGDIGRQFPASDERWRGAAGLDLLARAVQLVRGSRFAIINMDAIVILERPKLVSHIQAICANLARTLGTPPEVISVKAKTNEGVGEIGRGEAVACHAVALLARRM